MNITITSPINGATWNNITDRKQAAGLARCSTARIGEVVRAGKDTTLRNGYMITFETEATLPTAQVIELAKDMANGDYNVDPGFWNYEAYKNFMGGDRDSKFAQDLLAAL